MQHRIYFILFFLVIVVLSTVIVVVSVVSSNNHHLWGWEEEEELWEQDDLGDEVGGYETGVAMQRRVHYADDRHGITTMDDNHRHPQHGAEIIDHSMMPLSTSSRRRLSAKQSKHQLQEGGRRRSLSTCDPKAEIFMDIYDADADKRLGQLNDIIDLCSNEGGLTMVITPPCKTYAVFKLFNLNTGTRVFKAKRTGISTIPLSLGGYDATTKDFSPVDVLRVPAPYKLWVKAKPKRRGTLRKDFFFNVTDDDCTPLSQPRQPPPPPAPTPVPTSLAPVSSTNPPRQPPPVTVQCNLPTGSVSPQDQLMLELVNRARANPAAEAKLVISDGKLNVLPRTCGYGDITTASKQPLVFNRYLLNAARGHTVWMINTDTFSHTGKDGTTSNQRMVNAGYTRWSTTGENIAYAGRTFGTHTSLTISMHGNLFRSRGHRCNILKAQYEEIGISSLMETNAAFPTAWVTQNFAATSDRTLHPYITGVVYNDLLKDDDFYTIGEGMNGAVVEIRNDDAAAVAVVETCPTGAYQARLPPGTYDIFAYGDFNDDGTTVVKATTGVVHSSTKNTKVDFFN